MCVFLQYLEMDFTLVHGKQLRDFRVTKGSGLEVDIAEGNYTIGGVTGYFAGATGESVADDDTNYIQLNDTGSIIVNQTGFDFDKLPLAIVTTVSGVITSIQDSRSLFSFPGVPGIGSAIWRSGEPTGNIDSSNTTYTLPSIPDENSLILILDGMLLHAGAGNDYTLSGNTITFTTAPTTGSKLIYSYTESTPTAGARILWSEVTATSANMDSDRGYAANNSSLVELQLPSESEFGDEIEITGIGTGGWRITQGSNQQIHTADSGSTTVGVTGYVSSLNDKDSVRLVCVVPDEEWNIVYQTSALIIN